MIAATGNIGVQPSTWYHFAVTYDPVAEEMTLTVTPRGGPLGTRNVTEITVPPSGGANQATYMGGGEIASSYFEGVLDDVAFWSTDAVLTESEVEALALGVLAYDDLPT